MSKLVGFENGDFLPSDDADNTRERERVIVVMPEDDLKDASASEEPVVLVVTGEDETTTQPKIAVPPFGPFGFNLLSKEQRIQALWKEYENERHERIGGSYWVTATPAQWSCTVAGCDCGTHDANESMGSEESIADRYKRIEKSEWFLKSCEDKSTGGLEHLIDGGINEQ